MANTSLKQIVSKLREAIIKGIASKFDKFGFDKRGAIVYEKPLSEYNGTIRENIIVLFDAEKIHDEASYLDYIHCSARTFLHVLICFKLMEKRGIMKTLVSKILDTDIHDEIIPDFININPLAFDDFISKFSNEIDELSNRDNNEESIEYYQFLYLIEVLTKEMAKEVPLLFGDYKYGLVQPDFDDIKEILYLINSIEEDEYNEDDFLGWIYQYWVDTQEKEVKEAKKNEKVNYANSIFYSIISYLEKEQTEYGEFYTPRWVVKYVVDKSFAYHKQENIDVEKIRILDPACGAGNYLIYVFDKLLEIYIKEKPDWAIEKCINSIFTNNLFGADIQREPLQITAMNLWIKVQSIVRAENISSMNLIAMNILMANSLYMWESEEEYRQLSIFDTPETIKNGRYTSEDIGRLISSEEGINRNNAIRFFKSKFDIIVMNPPFVDTRKMNKETSDFLKEFYPTNSRNLFSAFIERAIQLLNKKGILGFISSETFMYIGSFQKIRELILEESSIKELIKLGRNVFEGPTVDAAITILQRNGKKSLPLIAANLSALINSGKKDNNTIFSLLENMDVYSFEQQKFKKILGVPFIFDISDSIRDTFIKAKYLGVGESYPAKISAGMQTGDNNTFLKKKWEIPESYKGSVYYPYAKGDGYSKYVNDITNYIVWDADAVKYYSTSKKARKNYLASYFNNGDETYYLKPAITYSDITSENYFSARLLPAGSVFDTSGSCIFSDEESRLYLLGYINSKFANYILSRLNPSPHFQVSDMQRIPYLLPSKEIYAEIVALTENAVKIKKEILGFSYNSDFFHEVELQYGFNNGAKSIEEAFEIYTKKYRVLCDRLSEIQNRIDELVYITFEVSEKDIEIIENEFPTRSEEKPDNLDIHVLLIRYIRFLIKEIMDNNFPRLYTMDEMLKLFSQKIEQSFVNGFQIIEGIEAIEGKNLVDIFSTGIKVGSSTKYIYGDGPNDEDEPIIQNRKLGGVGKNKQYVIWSLKQFLIEFDDNKKYTMQNEIRRITDEIYLPKLQRLKTEIQDNSKLSCAKQEKEVALLEDCIKNLENWKVVD